MSVWELTARGLPGDVLKGRPPFLIHHTTQIKGFNVCLEGAVYQKKVVVTSNIFSISTTFNYILAPRQTLVRIPRTSLMI